jgi:hypothetical protein
LVEVSELPAVHVLGPQALGLAPGTHASLSAVEEAAPLPAVPDAELPKKKRMKALKFFDGVTDAGAGSTGA